MMCPTCETVWVKELAHEGQTHVLRSKKKMDCPDCDTMAVDYLEDGSIAPHNCHKCKTVPVPLPHDEFYEYPGLG